MSDDTIALTHQGYSMLLAQKDERIALLEAQLRNTEHELNAYRDKIDKDELVRCLRAARDSYRSETYQLKEQLKNAEENERELHGDIADMRCSLMVARTKIKELQGVGVAA